MDQVIDARSLIGAAIWRDWLAAAMASGALAHPPIGTPSAQTQGGNSAPRALASSWAGGKSGV